MASPSGLRIEPSAAEKFFGLVTRPFSLTPDLRFAYHSRSHTHALEQVTSALRRREGLIVVTGAVGTGKTMLCRSMLDSFETRTFLSVILDPGLEVEDLLRQVLTDFGLMDRVDVPASGPLSDVTRHQFVTTLQRFLASLITLQAHAVIMIDEAQRLSPRVLEEIRLLSNFETDEAKLLQIVLVGQPELDDILRQPTMQQLNQRVARRCELQPLSEAEVGDYIERRLTVAAAPETSTIETNADADISNVVRFAPEAVSAVARISGGIPRLVNTLCDRTLDVAYERQIRKIDRAAVQAAAERLRLDEPDGLVLPARSRAQWIAAAAAALLIVGAGAWWISRPATTSAPPSARIAAQAPPVTAPPADTPPDRETPRQPDATPQRETSPGRETPPTPIAAAPSTPTAAPPSPAGTSSSSAPSTAPEQARTTSPAPSAAAAAASYQIAVAAFRTEARAQEVATAISGMQVPASVRLDSASMWYRVLAGPFASMDAARAAQEALTRAGYADTRISPVAPDAR